MKSNQGTSNEFLNPYRENKRCFVKYFKGGFNLNMSISKNSIQNNEHFLDNVSKASSMKFRDQSVEHYQNEQNQAETSLKESQFIILNKKKLNELQNPEMFQLLSKHIENIQPIIKKPKKVKFLKPSHDLLTERIKTRSNSVFQLQKVPKITQFSRQTFYRNPSSTRREYSSKKQREDFLHSNSNLDINSKKLAISKRTRPYKDGSSFITYEIYCLNKRIGIDVQILAGALKQIKFRLIMNQSDTKTFHNCWMYKIDEFIDKCLLIREDGISLRVGSFNLQNQTRNKSISRKYMQKVYLEKHESLIKKNSSKKTIKKIGHINYSQEYQAEEVKISPQKQIQTENLQIESNTKRQVDESMKEVVGNQNKQNSIEVQGQIRNQSIIQIDIGHAQESIEMQIQISSSNLKNLNQHKVD